MPRDDFETELNAQPSAYDVDTAAYGSSARRTPENKLPWQRERADGAETGFGSLAARQNVETSPPLRRAVTNASLALTGFKRIIADRNLKRSAKYPDSHLMTFSVLTIMILFEAVINANFYAKGSDLGLLGGWIQAVVVAFTNVIAAFFLIGFGAIRLAQTSWRRWGDDGSVRWSLSGMTASITGLLALPVAIAAIVVLNKAAAHFRDLLEANSAELATTNLVQSIGAATSPVALALSNAPIVTLEGLLLFILGITFACIAAYHGATFDDPVIGFGASERRLKRSVDQLEHALKTKSKDASQDLITTAQDQLVEIEDLFEALARVSGAAADKTLRVDEVHAEHARDSDRRG